MDLASNHVRNLRKPTVSHWKRETGRPIEQWTLPADTDIFLVGNRTGLAPGKKPLEVELKLLKRVPEEFRLHALHWLILHGRYTCKAPKPECPRCVVNDLCKFKGKTTAL